MIDDAPLKLEFAKRDKRNVMEGLLMTIAHKHTKRKKHSCN